MLQFLFILLSGITGFTLAIYPDPTSGNNLDSDGNSYGYGYSHSFSGTGPTLQPFPFGPGFDFSNLFINLNKFHQNLMKDGGGIYGYSHSRQNAKAEAFSSITFTTGKGDLSKRIQLQSSAVQNDGVGFGGGYGFNYPDGTQFSPGSGVSGSFTPNSQGATAFGSISPGDVHQGVFIFPENPNTPNVNVRFRSDQPDGFKSVFSSSFSYSTNVNGQPKTVQKATTTVNDNGKITTYTRESPRE